MWVRIAQSVQRSVRSWTFRGSNHGEGEIFFTCPDRPWGPPSLLYNRYRVIPGGKAAGTWRWSPTPPGVEVKEYICTSALPLGLHGLFYCKFYPFFYHFTCTKICITVISQSSFKSSKKLSWQASYFARFLHVSTDTGYVHAYPDTNTNLWQCR